MKSTILVLTALLAMFVTSACNQRRDQSSYRDNVKRALEQADLKDVTVREDADKNVIMLGGAVRAEAAKQQAAQVAQGAAGNRIIANEVSVQPVGHETDAKRIASNVDSAIEDNYMAALISKGLNKQSIRYDSKNGVLTLKGSVKSSEQRKEAEQVADNVPNVEQVVNEIQVRR